MGLPSWTRRLWPEPMTLPSTTNAAPMGMPPSPRPVRASALATAMKVRSSESWLGVMGRKDDSCQATEEGASRGSARRMHADRLEVRSENVGTAEVGEITAMTFDDKEKEGEMRQPDMESGGSQSPTSGGMGTGSESGGSGSESGTGDMGQSGGMGQSGDLGQSGDMGQSGDTRES